jgi:hypothetical protein
MILQLFKSRPKSPAEASPKAGANRAAQNTPLWTGADFIQNLRAGILNSPASLSQLMGLLTDPEQIRLSGLTPLAFAPLLDVLDEGDVPNAPEIRAALEVAVDLSVANVKPIHGRTLVALDCSGSMMGMPLRRGAFFAAALARAWNAEVLTFGTDTHSAKLSSKDSILENADWLENQVQMTPTNFASVFQRTSRFYNRIIVLTDLPFWLTEYSVRVAWKSYNAKNGGASRLYAVDVTGSGPALEPEPGVTCIAGLPEAFWGQIRHLEQDHEAQLTPMIAG